MTLILFPKSRKQTLDETMQHEFDRMPKAPAGQRFTPLNDLRLSDPDSTYIFVVLDDWDWQTYKWKRDQGKMQASPFVRSPVYVQLLLGSRAPALPDWYIVGTTRLYETMVFESTAPRPFSPGADIERAPTEGHLDPDAWISPGAGMPPVRADGVLAGSALRMDAAIANLAGAGVSLPTAVAAATSIPADLIGCPELGRIAPGAAGDLVWLGPGLQARATWIGGRQVFGAAAPVR